MWACCCPGEGPWLWPQNQPHGPQAGHAGICPAPRALAVAVCVVARAGTGLGVQARSSAHDTRTQEGRLGKRQPPSPE